MSERKSEVCYLPPAFTSVTHNFIKYLLPHRTPSYQKRCLSYANPPMQSDLAKDL